MLHEATTSITDFIMGAEALCFAALLAARHRVSPSLPYWLALLILLGLAGILGGFIHGLALHSIYNTLYLGMAALMVTFLLAVITDALGLEWTTRLRWPLVAVGVLFVLSAWLFPASIQAYALVEALIMVGAFIIYLRLALTRTLDGAGYLAAGIATTLIAAILLVAKVQLTLIWTFDQNGVYHLAQMVGIAFFYQGLRLRK